jgi:CBS domain-containing protein
MNYVNQLLDAKGHGVWSVTPETTVYDALVLMAEKNCGALVVLEEGKVVGIFSERDYARKVILKGKASKDTLVSEIMSTQVFFVRPQSSIEECMALMTDKRIRHLPVLEDGKVMGVISIGDL